VGKIGTLNRRRALLIKQLAELLGMSRTMELLSLSMNVILGKQIDNKSLNGLEIGLKYTLTVTT
jgi:hypothetical protein